MSARICSSARSLFPSASESTDTTHASASASSETDSDCTPCASRAASVGAKHDSFSDDHSSFFDDLVPSPALFQTVLHQGATLATGALSNLASVNDNLLPAFEYIDSANPPVTHAIKPPVSPSVSSSTSSSSSSSSAEPNQTSVTVIPLTSNPPVMVHPATVLPLPKDINVKDVKDYHGIPADLSLFDTQIENALDRWDIPAYYGRCATRTVQLGFEFVTVDSLGSLPN